MPTKSIAWNTGSGNITLTYQGQGDGPITVMSAANNLGSARSQTIAVETIGGAVVKNFTVSQGACPFPVGDVKTYSYTGSYQTVELPAGRYKLQVWGAQGGSNAAASSYGITAKTGGKGGYSEGIITLSQKTTVRVYVGGQGSSSAGGFNGGGSTTGSSSYNASNEQGVSRMGGGGGATDIRLSDGALLSRMIVAGGGSGGAMCYRKVTTSTTTSYLPGSSGWENGGIGADGANYGTYSNRLRTKNYINISGASTLSVTINVSNGRIGLFYYKSDYKFISKTDWITSSQSVTPPSGTVYIRALFSYTNDTAVTPSANYNSASVTSTTSSTSTSTNSQVGGVGGGTQGGGYSSTYVGKQDSAGSNGSFGQGAAMSVSNYRYCSGAGGGGWYGGGSAYSDSSITYCKYSGGGSGFVNTAASAGNRPSGYTGSQLDSGTTYAGDTSFPNTAGTGNETGHSGNGYAKITRLA